MVKLLNTHIFFLESREHILSHCTLLRPEVRFFMKYYYIQGQVWRKTLQLFSVQLTFQFVFAMLQYKKSLTYMLFVNSDTLFSLNQKQSHWISSTNLAHHILISVPSQDLHLHQQMSLCFCVHSIEVSCGSFYSFCFTCTYHCLYVLFCE